MYTNEQQLYIEFTEKINTKLLACAGSGKTFGIINRIDYLIKTKKFNNLNKLYIFYTKTEK